MKKIKRSTLTPLALLVYLVAIAVYAYPGRNPDMNITWLQYGLTIVITLVCIIVLRILLVKRENVREKIKKKDKEKENV
jgi:low affinity Fe/Cu permease